LYIIVLSSATANKRISLSLNFFSMKSITVPYFLSLWKRAESAVRDILSRLGSTKIVSIFDRSSAPNPTGEITSLPQLPSRPWRGYPPHFYPIDAFGISTPWFMPLHQILATPLTTF